MSTHPIENNKPEPRAHKGATSKGLSFARYFTKPGRHPYDELAWEYRSAVINGEGGQPVFEQHDDRGPASPGRRLATNVVASKYFRGQPGHPGARAQRAQLDRARRRHHHRLGPRSSGYFATRRGPARRSATS